MEASFANFKILQSKELFNRGFTHTLPIDNHDSGYLGMAVQLYV